MTGLYQPTMIKRKGRMIYENNGIYLVYWSNRWQLMSYISNEETLTQHCGMNRQTAGEKCHSLGNDLDTVWSAKVMLIVKVIHVGDSMCNMDHEMKGLVCSHEQIICRQSATSPCYFNQFFIYFLKCV